MALLPRFSRPIVTLGPNVRGQLFEFQLINLFAPMEVGRGHFGKTPCMRVLQNPLSQYGNLAQSVDKTMPSRLLQNVLHSQGRVSEQASSATAKDHSFAETCSIQHLVASLLEFLALKDLRVYLKPTLTAWPRVTVLQGQRCHGHRVGHLKRLSSCYPIQDTQKASCCGMKTHRGYIVLSGLLLTDLILSFEAD